MTAPLQGDDPLAALFLPPPPSPAVPLRYRSGLVMEWDVTNGANEVSIDGVTFTNLPVMPGSYLRIIKAGDVVSLLSTTDARGITTYAIVGIAITPPDSRIGSASAKYTGDWDIQPTSGNVTSTTYTDVLSAGVTPEVVFRALSGRCDILWGCYLVCGTSLGFAYMSFEVREGPVPGAGTFVLQADDARAIINRDNSAGGGDVQVGNFYPLDGLVPGAVYNARGMYRTSTGTSTFLNRTLSADPK